MTNKKSYLAGIIGCILLFTTPLAITALVIGLDGTPSCVTTYPGISFDFSTWLIIYGISEIMFIVSCVSGLILYVYGFEDCVSCLFCCITIPGLIFSFSWYIIGAFLFFQTVNNEKCMGQEIYDFGFAWFIIKTVTLCVNTRLKIND